MPEQRLVRVELPPGPTLQSAAAAADREQAAGDLALRNRFDPKGIDRGPYVLHLCIRDGRLVFDIRDMDNRPLRIIALALGPFRRLVKDYQMVVAAHEQAVAESGPESRVQAMDMGRRGLHNEAAELLTERLRAHVAVDFDTARRLFTLVCALHQRI